MDLAVIILAAGKGERMQSELPKVLHSLLGEPLLAHVLNTARVLKPKKQVVVVGYKAQEVKATFAEEKNILWVLQPKQLGTAHAVLCTSAELKRFRGKVLILYGDVPLLKSSTLQLLLSTAWEKKADLVLATTQLENPNGYGRIVRNARGEIARIVEEKEATPGEKVIKEINPGIYLLDASLLDILKKIQKSAAKKEYYLTDLVSESLRAGKSVATCFLKDSREVLGVNTKSQLAQATAILRSRIQQEWLEKGVVMIAPESTWIDAQVQIGSDVVLHPGVILQGKTRIKQGAEILAYSVIEDCEVGEGARVGPFAHLRPGSVVGRGAHVGNFVELKKTILGEGAKANHLAYLGDAIIGDRANIGAGTITCNYDGLEKHKTFVGEEAFIGSDSQLVAPVKIGKKAYVGSGTTVTKDVPAGALAISRVEQHHILNWRKKK